MMPRRQTQIAISVFLLGIAFSRPAGAQAPGSLAGVVREDSTGRPIVGAEVSIELLKRQTLTDAEGRFRLPDVAAGAHTVNVRRLGYAPFASTVQFLSGEMAEKAFTLKSVALPLDTMRVREREPRPLTARSAFYDRRERGFGRFLDSTDLKKLPELHIHELLQAEQNIQLARAPPCRPYSSRDFNCVLGLNHRVAVTKGLCAMKVMLDGMVLTYGGPIDTEESRKVDPRRAWYRTFDLATLNVASMDKIEIYRRSIEVPAEFQSAGTDCGLLVLWTKQY